MTTTKQNLFAGLDLDQGITDHTKLDELNGGDHGDGGHTNLVLGIERTVLPDPSSYRENTILRDTTTGIIYYGGGSDPWKALTDHSQLEFLNGGTDGDGGHEYLAPFKVVSGTPSGAFKALGFAIDSTSNRVYANVNSGGSWYELTTEANPFHQTVRFGTYGGFSSPVIRHNSHTDAGIFSPHQEEFGLQHQETQGPSVSKLLHTSVHPKDRQGSASHSTETFFQQLKELSHQLSQTILMLQTQQKATACFLIIGMTPLAPTSPNGNATSKISTPETRWPWSLTPTPTWEVSGEQPTNSRPQQSSYQTSQQQPEASR